MRIVDGVVESAAFVAFERLAHHEVSDVYDVAQLAELSRGVERRNRFSVS